MTRDKFYEHLEVEAEADTKAALSTVTGIPLADLIKKHFPPPLNTSGRKAEAKSRHLERLDHAKEEMFAAIDAAVQVLDAEEAIEPRTDIARKLIAAYRSATK